MSERDQKQRPIVDRRTRERVIRSAPEYPLTPGLRRQTTSAIGFVHKFDREEDIDLDRSSAPL